MKDIIFIPVQTEPDYLEVYNLCKNCKNSEKIEERHKLPFNHIKYREKRQWEIRTRYKCRLSKCELKEV